MLKRLLASLALSFVAARLGATAIDDALATARDLQGRVNVAAGSSLKSPSVDKFSQVKGDASALGQAAANMASQLSGINVGPASQVRSVCADLTVHVNTVEGSDIFHANALIEAAQRMGGPGGDIEKLQGMLPDLINALLAEKARALAAVQAATQWTPPTAVPGAANPGQFAATPTPQALGSSAGPTPVPTSIIPLAPPASLPPPGNPGTLPGGPSLPPSPPSVSQPTPQSSATPRAQLKAPVALASDGDDGEGDKVYVANVNAGTVGVLDTGLKRVVKQVRVGSQPVALALGHEHGPLLVANFGSNSVSVIDTGSDSVIATINVGVQPVDIAVSGDGDKAYVVNQGSNSVTVIDLRHLRAGKNISVGLQPSRIRFNGNNSRRIYVSNTNDDSVAIIDTSSDDLIATVSE